MKEKRVDFFRILKNEERLETLLLYAGKETENDPTEHTTTIIYMNPIPVEGIVRQISQSALRWKFYGLIPSKSIEVVTDLKNETLFKTAKKIKYGDDFFHVIKDDSQNFMITKRSDYIIVILGLKNL